LDEEGRALVLDVKGCPEEQRALVLKLAEMSIGQADNTALFDLFVRHRRGLPEGAAAQLCRLARHRFREEY
jgi:hypothetical protein